MWTRRAGQVAALINAEPREIIFTSCGTESNNSAIHSALVTQPEKRHVLTTAVEHSANTKFCALLQKRGYTVTFLPVASRMGRSTWSCWRSPSARTPPSCR